MNVLIINGSPSGEESITLCTMRYIKKLFPNHRYKVLHVGRQIRKMEQEPELWQKPLKAANLIVFCYPVYTFLVPSQLHHFIELMKGSNLDLSEKYATQISTSKHFYDITAHTYIEDNCFDMDLKVLHGLSADMEDLLSEQGRAEARSFFKSVLWNMENGYFEKKTVLTTKARIKNTKIADTKLKGKAPKRIVIVADYSNSEDGHLEGMCNRLASVLPCKTEIVNIQEFPFYGGCLGCFHCAGSGKCIYKDGFDEFLRKYIQTDNLT